ncbi:MAG: holo-ACP synthase [Bacteroidota bacterium]
MNKDLLLSTACPPVKRNITVGNDLVFLPSFSQSLTAAFKTKVYTLNEINYCNLFNDSLLRYASTWAAKEAVYKAVKQIDKSALPFNKIEILREEIGKRPYVVLHKVLKQAVQISLTITHDGDYAWAIAIVELP